MDATIKPEGVDPPAATIQGPGANLQELEHQTRHAGLGMDFAVCRQWILDHPTSSETFACPNCDKVYRHKHNLRRHINVECGKQPQLQCPFCDYRFKHKCTLQKHMDRKHSSVVPGLSIRQAGNVVGLDEALGTLDTNETLCFTSPRRAAN